ncbi:MAG: hypothetical protein WCJ51_05010 [Candidatus Moraniibacteriota bacterium]
MEKKKKPTKKNSNKLTENQFGAILENINSKLDLVLESYDTLDKKVDRLHLETKEDLNDFKVETRRNFKQIFEFQDKAEANFKQIFEFQDKAEANFKQIFEFQDRADANFKVTLEYLSRLDDEVQILKEELKNRPALMAIFEDRIKKMEKDLILCKKALAT